MPLCAPGRQEVGLSGSVFRAWHSVLAHAVSVNSRRSGFSALGHAEESGSGENDTAGSDQCLNIGIVK